MSERFTIERNEFRRKRINTSSGNMRKVFNSKVFIRFWAAYMALLMGVFLYSSVMNATTTIFMSMVGTLATLLLALRSLKK